MKRLVILSTILSIQLGCSHKEVAPTTDNTVELTNAATAVESPTQDEQKIRGVLLSVNPKIRADYSKANKRNFSKFDEAAYVKIMNQYDSSRFQSMKEYFPEFETRDIKGHKATYVFCGYSTKHQIAFCDDANCVGVEHFEKANSPAIIESWKANLPLASCKK